MRNADLSLTTGIALAVLVALWAPSALAAEDAPTANPPSAETAGLEHVRLVTPSRGIWTGDEYRYPRYGIIFWGLPIRTAMDMVSIPTGVVGWGVQEWTILSALTASAVVLSIPFDGVPFDVRVQREAVQFLNGQPKIWTPLGNTLFWLSVAALPTSLFLYGWLGDQPSFEEMAVLMVEGQFVAQMFHLLLKFVTGREGPEDGSRLGKYKGPSEFFKVFPSGTPSGHLAAVVGSLTGLVLYQNRPWLTVSAGVVVAFLATTLITNNQHFLSEVILGTAIGYSVGRWVIHHRSSLFRNAPENSFLSKVVVTPVLVGRGTTGLGLTFAF